MWDTFASSVGIIGASALMAQMTLGNRWLTRWFTADLIKINGLHQRLGKYGVIFFLIHPLLMVYLNGKAITYLLMPSSSSVFERYVGLGRMALVWLTIIAVTSIFWRKQLKFRPWKYIHYLVYPMMALILWHAHNIGTLVNSYPLLRGYLNSLMLIYGLLVTGRLLFLMGVGKKTFIIKEKKYLSTEITEYRLIPEGIGVKPEIGQFCYLQLHRGGEEHPFSVTEVEGNKLIFTIKTLGKYTRAMKKLRQGDRVWIDGPYGKFTQEGQNQDPKILVAGGIGITPFVRLVKAYSQETYLFYSNRTETGLIRRADFKEKLANRYVEVITSKQDRLAVDRIKEVVAKPFWGQANFFICGPEGFSHSFKQTLIFSGIPKEKIFVEEFSL